MNSGRKPYRPLDGRPALVTGASSGIGRHLSKSFASSGARIALAARRIERIREVKEEIEADGGEAIAIEMDVTDRQSVERGVEQAEEIFGSIDILLNNAGAAKPASFLDMSECDWQSVIETSLTGMWRVGQVVARGMARRRRGSIINVASAAGLAVQSRQANYSAAKAGVIHLTRVMAYELRRNDVRVNAIAPGYFKTELNAEFLGTDSGRAYIDHLVPGRLGNLDELEGLTVLLASDAASFITGAVIPVDGGTILKGL